MKKALNVLLGVLMVVTVGLTAYAIAAGGSDAAISLNLIWGYCLMIGAVVAAVGGAIYSTLKSPAGAKMSILSVVLILAIVGVAYLSRPATRYRSSICRTTATSRMWIPLSPKRAFW